MSTDRCSQVIFQFPAQHPFSRASNICGASSGMARRLYFCVFHVMWCSQTERAEEPPTPGWVLLKTLALPHKARPTELRQTLKSMVANARIVIHLEPAAPDVNKQHNFPALHFTPTPTPPFLYSPQPILGLYSLHTVIPGSKLFSQIPFPLQPLWRHSLFPPPEVSIVRGSFNKLGLAWKRTHKKNKTGSLRWRTSLRWGLVSSSICKWHWLSQGKRFLLLRCGIPAGNLLGEHRNVATGDCANSQRRTAVITIFCSDSQAEEQRKITQACHWRTDVCFPPSARWLTW